MNIDNINVDSNEYKTLRSYHYSSLILGSAFCLFFIYVDAWLNLIAPAAFLVMVCVSIILRQVNQIKYASITLVCSLWVAPAWCILVSNGLYSPLLIWLTPTILMAGILLGSQWAIFIGTLSFLFIINLFIFNNNISMYTEFKMGAVLDTLFVLSGTSAVLLISFYGYVFTRDLKNKSNEIIHSRDEAFAANQAKSEFLSSMNHELHTPMNAILGFSQLLIMDSKKIGKEQASHVREIQGAGNHMLYLINELLDLGEIESGKLNIIMGEVSIDKVLKQCVPLIQEQLNKNQIEFYDNLSNKKYVVYADFDRLKQVLMVLLSNAIKYNSPGGKITIDGQIVDEHHLRIRVIDTGQGISEIDMTKLFIAFERLNKVHNVEGAGIGLVVSKNIIERMEGDIGVTSVLGEGSTFWIDLMIATSD